MTAEPVGTATVGSEPAVPDEPADGRLARSHRTRTLILDTILELIADLGRLPSGDEVAERSGTSVRSIFRHFSTLDELRSAAFVRHFEQLAPHFGPIEATGSFDERVTRLVERRGALYAEAAPVWRVATSEGLVGAGDERLAAARDFAREEFARLFDRELSGLASRDRETVLDAVLVAASFEVWNQLHLALGRDDPRSDAVMARLVAGAFAVG